MDRWQAGCYIFQQPLLEFSLLGRDAQHHGKQGLVLVVAWLALFVANVIPFLGQIAWFVGSLLLLMLVILGIVNALNGKFWEMPFLGEYAKQIKL